MTGKENDVGLIITCYLTIFVLNLKEFCLDFEFCVFLDLVGTFAFPWSIPG